MRILLPFTFLIAPAASMCAGTANAEPTNYGAFKYYSELPQVLFMTGEVKSGDSFELRRAMRDQDIKLIVTASPGGNLYDGLQIAAIINDNSLGTYVPLGASCESSCANIFLGGVYRLLVGELGVHQFFSSANDADSAAPQSVTTAVAQYTTADIIGIMNQFDTPPFVYEKMFGTTDIYYFRPSEKPRLNLGLDEVMVSQTIADVDVFLASMPAAIDRSSPTVEPREIASAPVITPSELQPEVTRERAALDFLISINQIWSLPNEQALSRILSYYAPSVIFYGKQLSQAEVFVEKDKFAKRWPVRSYWPDPESISINCDLERCAIEAVINWSASSPERGAHATGLSAWSLVLVSVDGQLRIGAESGKTLKRN